jgi:hypothetical protein
MSRAEWIKCIAHDHEKLKGTTWCGRKLEAFEWAFVNPGHAAYAGRHHDRLLACRHCIQAVYDAMRQKCERMPVSEQ